MPEQTTRTKSQGEVPYSIAEYTVLFKTPIFDAWTAPTLILKRMLEVLEPWGFRIDGVEDKTRGVEKLADYAILFRRTSPAAPALTISLGLAKLIITIENPSWEEAGQLLDTLTAARDAIIEIGQPTIQSQHLALAMHIQIKTKAVKDLTVPLLHPVALQILDGEIKSTGIVLHAQTSSVILDTSLAYANALFVRILRDHPPEATIKQVAEALYKDEEHLLDVLGLEGIL